jgi:hypothetical protein
MIQNGIQQNRLEQNSSEIEEKKESPQDKRREHNGT